MKWFSSLPLLGFIATQGFFEKAFGVAKRSRYDNIYTRIGVKPIINARGPWTYISGSLERP
jgi:L-seryl-tRNA(Ser) seleniumtransferase